MRPPVAWVNRSQHLQLKSRSTQAVKIQALKSTDQARRTLFVCNPNLPAHSTYYTAEALRGAQQRRAEAYQSLTAQIRTVHLGSNLAVMKLVGFDCLNCYQDERTRKQ